MVRKIFLLALLVLVVYIFGVVPYRLFSLLAVPTRLPTVPTLSPTILPTVSKASNLVRQETVTALRALHLRSGPDVTFDVTTVLTSGQVVEVTGVCQNGWAPVQFGKFTGWVNADYLSGSLCP